MGTLIEGPQAIAHWSALISATFACVSAYPSIGGYE
jgi:hypothetical protein